MRSGGLTPPTRSGGLTIVEMLVAMAITLLIMAAVVTVFANISGSVTRRRATIEMASALRNVRETLARDLEGATCPAVTWQRPESNHGYLEVIEGPQNDSYPTPWLWDSNQAGGGDSDALPDEINGMPGIDLVLSSLPGSNLGGEPVNDIVGQGAAVGSLTNLRQFGEQYTTDGRGLGDGDDILMLTVRNEKQPFVGRIPKRYANDRNEQNTPLAARVSDPGSRPFPLWDTENSGGGYTGGYEQAESTLAEVVWYALENPVDPKRTFAFGEPGYRTIYRRALLILPELDYRIRVGGQVADPGVVWVLPESNAGGGPLERRDVATALASLIAFQERYDLSVRLEWAPLLPNSQLTEGVGRWVLKANTLADLTKRENRYEHHGYAYNPPGLQKPADNPESASTGVSDRYFPFAVASGGFYPPGQQPLEFRGDAAFGSPATSANFDAYVTNAGALRGVVAFQPNGADTADDILGDDRVYAYRPFVRVTTASDVPATARAVLDEDGHVVHVTRGLAPLGKSRRGDDVMMTDALAFDLRVYDPGAPVYAIYSPSNLQNADGIVSPGDPSWARAYTRDAVEPGSDPRIGDGTPVATAADPFFYQRQGAYVDLGWGQSFEQPIGAQTGQILAQNRFAPFSLPIAPGAPGLVTPRFAGDGAIRLPTALLPSTTFYSVYDTWSWHYETNGVNEDLDNDAQGRPTTDEGANGLDDRDPTLGGDRTRVDNAADVASYGPDDPAERETRPPYDTALRGLQVTMRVYERDSRQIREVRVLESFVPE